MRYTAIPTKDKTENKIFIAALKVAEKSGNGSLKKIKAHLDKIIAGK